MAAEKKKNKDSKTVYEWVHEYQPDKWRKIEWLKQSGHIQTAGYKTRKAKHNA